MKKILTILITTFICQGIFAQEIQFKSQAKDGKVNFVAIGNPSFLKIEGQGEGPIGELTVNGKVLNGQMSFRLDSMTTGIDTRDEHMKEKYLKTKEHPVALMKLENVELQDNINTTNPVLKLENFRATLVLNGVENKEKIQVQITPDASEQKVKAQFKLKLTDYDIEIPSFAGITVADEIELEINTKISTVGASATTPAR